MDFKCPNCGSDNYIGKHTTGKYFKNSPYSDVKFEIQCSNCFIDIPSILCENINEDKKDAVKKLWFEKYKPEHLKHASNCSKCNRKYWEIEKHLSNNSILSNDIFYQNYNPKNGAGDLICKICDPKAFK